MKADGGFLDRNLKQVIGAGKYCTDLSFTAYQRIQLLLLPYKNSWSCGVFSSWLAGSSSWPEDKLKAL